jgi:hypothetical protein
MQPQNLRTFLFVLVTCFFLLKIFFNAANREKLSKENKFKQILRKNETSKYVILIS